MADVLLDVAEGGLDRPTAGVAGGHVRAVGGDQELVGLQRSNSRGSTPDRNASLSTTREKYLHALPDAEETAFEAPSSFVVAATVLRHRPTTPSRNTVYLSDDDDRVGRRSGGLRPGSVLGPLDAVVGHLAFDDAGIGASAPGRQHLKGDLLAGLDVGGVKGPRGGNPGGMPWSGGPPAACA